MMPVLDFLNHKAFFPSLLCSIALFKIRAKPEVWILDLPRSLTVRIGCGGVAYSGAQ